MNFYKTQDRPNSMFFINGKKNEYFNDVIKTFMGRDALRIFLYNTKPKKVLIPAYICQEVINEFRRGNCEINYYDINSDFSIDCDTIIDKIKANRIDLFYYVVYFGIANNNSIAKKIKCNCTNVKIIEDRAHYLSNDYDLINCDAYIYSFRKLLPISEGGGIKSILPLEINFSNLVLSNILPFMMYMKKKLLGYNDKYNRTSLTNDKFQNSIMPMSKFSSTILEKYDYISEIQFRRNCFNKWIEKLKRAKIKPVFNILEDASIPLGCPIYVENPEKVQEYMRQKKYYLKRHWKLNLTMIEIAPIAFSISNKIITLPIYRGIDENMQENIINLLESF